MPAQSLSIWQDLPPFYWYAVAQPKPAAQVLAVHPGPIEFERMPASLDAFAGGFVAAPGRPWAWANELQHLPVYIAVWSRDLYQIATALLAGGLCCEDQCHCLS